jgi:3-methylcrotonyl-CoA carboxylase alpha subunit
MRKIKKLLVANRGEIACKIIKSAKKLNIPTLAIYSDEDINSIHVSLADEAINIPGSNVSDTYMNSMAIINICKKYKANAIHPGYGLLSENAAFVELVEKNNLIFVGPNSEIIRNMGQKDKAKSLMENAGLPVVPGYHGAKQDKDFLKQTASNIGYPVLIKAVAGGGGRGMRIAEDNKTFLSALTEASNEAKTNFQDKNCLIEKYIPLARHIEIQIFADKHGNVIHLFDRDCSLQRRQQKIIEEAPAPKIDDEIRSFLGDISVKAAKAIQYEGAGTIEFIADIKNGLDKNKIYFMEMNTRIQVEHPVTEAVTSTDLITWQLQIANGKKLPKLQDEVSLNGWSIEARLYAEDVSKDFIPQTGFINHFNLPNQLRHPNCFIETGTKKGDYITPYYDPMIAKIISHGTNRNESIRNLQRYLGELEIAGIITNLNLLKKLLNNKNFKEANLDTKFVENNIKKLTEDSPQTSHIALAGLIIFKNLIKNENNYWSMWRPSQYPIKLIINNTIFSLNFIYSTLDNIEVHFDDLKFKFYSVKIDDSHILTKLNGKDEKVTYNSFTEKNLGNQIFTIFTKENTFEAQVFNSMIFEENQKEVSQDNVLSPMHGVIKFKNIKKGLHVKKGEVLMLLEAMKMEYSLTCPRNGIIEEIHVKDGQQAGEGMELLTLKKDLNDG